MSAARPGQGQCTAPPGPRGLTAALLATPLLLATALSAQTALTALTPLPDPDLSNLEPGVQERLDTAREALLTARDDPDASQSDLAELYGRTGQVFQAHHVFAVAEACYRNAAALAPGEILWPYLLGFTYQDTGRFPEAQTQYEKVLEIAEDHDLASYRLAQVLLEQSELDAAAPLLERIVDQPAVSAAAHAGLGKIAATGDANQEAVEHYEAALELQPEASQLHFPLAMAYRDLGDIDKAREQAALRGQTKVVVQDPLLAEVGSLTVSSEMFLMTGARAVKAGRPDTAEKAFRAAIAAKPDNSRAHLNLATVLLRKGDLDGAEASARKALELNPDYFFAYLDLATILDKRGDRDGATEYFEKALLQDPTNVQANFQFANLLMRRGDYARAIERYSAVRERAPGHVQARYLETLALIALERYDEAKTLLDEALRISPEDLRLAEALARLLATSDSADEEDAERALALAEPLYQREKSIDHAESLAMAFAAAGRWQEAVSLQRAVLNAASELGDDELIGHLEHNLGRYEKGLAADRPWP